MLKTAKISFLITGFVFFIGIFTSSVLAAVPITECLPDDTLVKLANDSAVYVIKSCQKWLISDPSVFNASGYQWSNIQTVTPDKINTYQTYIPILIKAVDEPLVYRIVNSKKFWVPSALVFESAGYQWSDITIVSKEQRDSYPEISLIKPTDSDKVYALNKGLIRHIPNPSVFESSGYKWEDIVTINPTELKVFNETNLIRGTGDLKVYVAESGTKRWITTPQSFNNLGYDWNKIMEVNSIELNSYPNGNTISSSPELQSIQQAIISKGAQWVADKTSVSDLSLEEKQKLTGMKPVDPSAHAPTENWETLSLPADIPSSFDWRDNSGNYVTPPKYQGSCGSCWAFGSTAGLESAILIVNKTPFEKNPINLSEQTLISCSNYGSCAGGLDPSSFLMQTGLPDESCYPYHASDGNCANVANACPNWTQNAYKLTGVVPVWNNMNALKRAIYNYGPVFTGFNLFSDFFSYRRGIYKHVWGRSIGGHAVLIVGYNDTEKYFIVKNSWGIGWGENGYFRIAYSEFDSDTYFGQWGDIYTAKKINKLTVVLPTLNDKFTAGIATKVAWIYPEKLSDIFLTIDLLKNKVYQQTLAKSLPIDQNGYGEANNILFPCDLPIGNDYQFKLTPTTAAGEIASSPALSEKFSIERPSDPEITIIDSSIKTFSQTTGYALKLSWEYQAICHPRIVNITLLRNDFPYTSIARDFSMGSCRIDGYCPAGRYTWQIPSSVPPGSNYRIKVEDANDVRIFDWSEVFSIVSNINITSVSPSSAKIGDIVTISGSGFTSDSNNLVTFVSGSQTLGSIGTRYINSSTLYLTIPPELILPAPPCPTGASCMPPAPKPLAPGKYLISVTNSNGISNNVVLTVL